MDNYPQTPANNVNTQNLPAQGATSHNIVFPYEGSIQRLGDYDYYERLFLGDHFTAFNIRIDNEGYTKAYERLRYVKVNFAGLLSKIIADMLFSEPITVKDEDNQDFVDALWHENRLDVQCYESALSNSALGDAIFKVRVGKRNETDKASTVIIEDITPKIYFPNIDGFNVRATPNEQELSWTFKSGGKEYLRKEIHKSGKIINEVYEMQGNKISTKVGLDILGIAGLQPEVATGIEESLIVHIPNWKMGNRYFGISDYYDIDSIFYAINNRMTKIDNILDKHGDPILMVPKGVMDEKGNVNKKALGVIEVVDGETAKPEYIVWDASLENAFKEIEKLVEFMYLIGEISPDILGVGSGTSDSGRALKFKLMRTIAKTARKKLYYDYAIKQVIYVAELMAKAHNIEIGGYKVKEPKKPEIQWADGLPIDNGEQIDNEIKAVDANLTSRKDAIMRIYNVDEKVAEEMIDEIDKDGAITMPKTNLTGSFGQNKGNNSGTPKPNEAGDNGNDPNNNDNGGSGNSNE